MYHRSSAGRRAGRTLNRPGWQRTQTMRRSPGCSRAAAGMTAIAMLVAGCSAAKSVGAAPRSVSGRGPITFATGKLGSGYLPGLVSQWNAGHPRQRVTVIYLPTNADAQHAQLVENLQGRSDVYDVMNLDVIWTPEFASNGWISPVSPKLVPLSQFL